LRNTASADRDGYACGVPAKSGAVGRETEGARGEGEHLFYLVFGQIRWEGDHTGRALVFISSDPVSVWMRPIVVFPVQLFLFDLPPTFVANPYQIVHFRVFSRNNHADVPESRFLSRMSNSTFQMAFPPSSRKGMAFKTAQTKQSAILY
jgi:hypothetical protein